MSTKTGLKPFKMTEFISETHVKVGTKISPLPSKIFNADIESKFAEEPEFTNTLYFTPSHCDHFFSKSATFLDWVNELVFFRKFINFFYYYFFLNFRF